MIKYLMFVVIILSGCTKLVQIEAENVEVLAECLVDIKEQ